MKYPFKVIETTYKEVGREPLSPGTLWITENGYMFFDSVLHDKRIGINTVYPHLNIGDIDDIKNNGTVLIESTNTCSNLPINELGVLTVFVGDKFTFQKYTSITNKQYFRAYNKSTSQWSEWAGDTNG